MHAGEGTLQAYLDGEVRAADHAGVEAHVATCPPCRSELDTLRRLSGELHDALALIDSPAPVERAAAAFAAQRRTVPIASRRNAGHWTRASVLKAATLILAFAGVASAAVPNSPLRRWVSGAWDRVSALFSQPQVAEQTPPAPAVVPPSPAPVAQEPVGGMGIRPDMNGNVRVVLDAPAQDVSVTVRLVDGNQVSVRTTSQKGYRIGSGLLELRNVGGSDVTIELGRAVPHAAIEVGGRVWYTRDGDNLKLLGPVSESSDDSVRFNARY
jgi:hypothetical protein